MPDIPSICEKLRKTPETKSYLVASPGGNVNGLGEKTAKHEWHELKSMAQISVFLFTAIP